MTKLCDMGDVELVQLIIRARDNWLDVGPIKEELIRRLGRLRGRVAELETVSRLSPSDEEENR